MKIRSMRVKPSKPPVKITTFVVISLIMFCLGFYSPVFWLITLIPVGLIIYTVLKAKIKNKF